MCLYRGQILNNTENKYVDCKIKVLKKNWTDAILELQSYNYKFIRDKNLYVPITLFELNEIFNSRGYILGVIVNEELIAFRILSFHDEETLKLAQKANLDDPSKVIFFESTLVDYNYIGNGLQKKMIGLSLEKIIDKTLFEFGISTVSPKNIPSIRSLLKMGFYIKGKLLMYGGKERFLCIIDFSNDKIFSQADNPIGQIYDFNRQAELFVKGYKIIDIEKDNYIFSK